MEVWKEQIKHCVYHEVGHWIVARHLGFESVSIDLELAIKGRKLQVVKGRTYILYHPSLSTLADLMKYISERAIVGLSGVNCQCILLNINIKEAIDMFGSEDYEKAQELSLIYRGVKYPNDQSHDSELAQRNEFMTEALVSSKKIIEEMDGEIKRVSESILHKINNTEGKYCFPLSQLDEWCDKKD